MYKPYNQWGSRQGKPEKASSNTIATLRTGSAAKICDRALLDDCQSLIHLLVLCPPIAKGARYLLVERKWWGQRDVLKVGRARSPHGSLNLARVRHTAARLGATEVHILPN
jgi:hypothetical protein